MHRFIPRRLVLPALLAAVFAAIPAGEGRAADPQKEILDGLRAKGEFQAAIDYLQKVRSNPGLPKGFAELIDYELAATHVEAAQRAAVNDRDKHLLQAQQALTAFLAGFPEHPSAHAARTQLGNLLLDRGRARRIEAGRFEGPAREQQVEAARELLRQADDVFAGIDKSAEAELKQVLFVRGDDVKRSQARDQIHRRQLQARLGRAWVRFERGAACAAGSQERATALVEAGSQFDLLYDQQRDRLGGFYARLGRGLCHKELGEAEKAFAIFEELFNSLPDDPADFHVLRGKAGALALETALRPDMKKYKPGLDIAQRWSSGDGSAVAAALDADLAIRYLGAEAAMAYAQSLPADSPEQAALRKRPLDWARQQLGVVAAASGPYQSKAKVRLLDPVFGAGPIAEPATFADARNRAKAAMDRLMAVEANRKEAARSGAADDPDTRRQRDQQVKTAHDEALKYCRLAAGLHTADVAAEEFDVVRYYLTYLAYSRNAFEEAAKTGEEVAQASSDSDSARQAARIGLAAREILCRRAIGEARATAVERLQSLAEKIVDRWGGRAEADDARGILLELALAEGRLESAEGLLPQIAATSPRRGEAELALGRALWIRSERLLQTSTPLHDHTAEAETTSVRAAELLAGGMGRVRKAVAEGQPAPPSLVSASLALARIRLASGRAGDAVALLSEPEVAALDEVRPLVLLACLAAGQVDRARDSLKAIEASLPAPGNGDRPRKMLQACLGFHRLLKLHVARYRDRRQDEVLSTLKQSLDELLNVPPETTAGFFVAAWRAEACAGLAAGLDVGGPGVVPEVEKRYRRAITAIQELLHRAAKEPGFSPSSEIIVALRIELARCLRRLSDNPQALSQLLAVLQHHPAMVDAQTEAAYTYQSWGEEKPEYLEMAIAGGQRYREVWGWGELARRVQGEARFRGAFHEARYNLAFCRFRQAQMATDRSQRAQLAMDAERDIQATQRTYPDMGGPVWYDKYEELLKRIQRLADRPAVGFAESDRPKKH